MSSDNPLALRKRREDNLAMAKAREGDQIPWNMGSVPSRVGIAPRRGRRGVQRTCGSPPGFPASRSQ
eukprot:1117148-Lingulodinium_polyedra.AAC.1